MRSSDSDTWVPCPNQGEARCLCATTCRLIDSQLKNPDLLMLQGKTTVIKQHNVEVVDDDFGYPLGSEVIEEIFDFMMHTATATNNNYSTCVNRTAFEAETEMGYKMNETAVEALSRMRLKRGRKG